MLLRFDSSAADRTRLLPLLPPMPPVSSLSRKRESREPVSVWRQCPGGDGEGDEAAVVEAGERLWVILQNKLACSTIHFVEFELGVPAIVGGVHVAGTFPKC